MRFRALASLVVSVAASAALAGDPTDGFSLRSTAFSSGQPIPAEYTCDGADVSPPLAWTAPPTKAKALALVVEDPDAPDPAAPKRIWVHWLLVDLPASAGSLDAGIRSAKKLPAGARVGRNDWGHARYQGPCPPTGRHRYFFRLLALDAALPALASPSREELLQASAGHVIATAELMGTYVAIRP
jgi:Raf kinase inhibitor-like YbhB/YbcL family protein